MTRLSSAIASQVEDSYQGSGRVNYWPTQFVGLEGASIAEATAAMNLLVRRGVFNEPHVEVRCQFGHTTDAGRRPPKPEAFEWCPACDDHPGECTVYVSYSLNPAWRRQKKSLQV